MSTKRYDIEYDRNMYDSFMVERDDGDYMLFSDHKWTEELLRRVVDSGVEMDDERIDYLVVQIDRDLLTDIRTLIGEKKS